MARPSLFGRYTDNALVGAAVTATPAPATSYDENDLKRFRPAKRVLWSVGSPNVVTIRVVPDSSKRVDLVVIPVCSADDATITITSSTGMSEDLGAPVLSPSGMSYTLAVDLRDLEPDAAKRTSAAWFDIAFAGMSQPLCLGGFLGLYGPARPFIERDWRWGFSELPVGYQAVAENDHGTQYIATRRTQGRSFQFSGKVSEADRLVAREWLDANFIGGLPSFLWIDPDGRDIPIVGYVDATSLTDDNDEAIEFGLTYVELGKGKPIA